MKEQLGFIQGEYVVYPAHGVGKIEAMETQTIGEHELKVFVISFDDERMKLRLPVAKAVKSGLRNLSSSAIMKKALATLKGKSKVKRGVMWSRRAQEYETKINSGDPLSIAEVIRDLHKGHSEADQSYSERQLYHSAIDRLARELAVVCDMPTETATCEVNAALEVA